MSPEERARELLPILIARAASSQDEQCINLLAAAIRAAVAEEREANKRATVDAVRAERERCAKVAERAADEADSYTTHMALHQFAAAIREEPT